MLAIDLTYVGRGPHEELVAHIAAATGRPYRYEPETVEQACARR
jgi:hypothetical protein